MIYGEIVVKFLMQDFIGSAMNSCGCCSFPYGPTDSNDFVLNYLEAVTGRTMTLEALLQCGERSFNVKRAFNVMAGKDRKDEVLPKRFTHDALKAGASQGLVARTQEMLDAYYEERGWDKDSGLPTRQKLEQLELTTVADRLEGLKG